MRTDFEALKNKAYVLDVIAGLVPSDDEFGEVWAIIPDNVDMLPAAQCGEIAKAVRSIMWAHSAKRADAREG